MRNTSTMTVPELPWHRPEARMRNFNETTGVLGYISAAGPTGANLHPDRCRCQGQDTTPHKHRADGSCARCVECNQYVPAIPR